MLNTCFGLLLLLVLVFQFVSAAPLVDLRISSLGYQHYRGAIEIDQKHIKPYVERAYQDMKTLHAAEMARWQHAENARRAQWAQIWNQYVAACRQADHYRQPRPKQPDEPKGQRRPIDLPAMMSGLYYHDVLYLSSSAKRVQHGIPYPSDFPPALKTAMDDCKTQCGSDHRHSGACSEPMAWAVFVGKTGKKSLPEQKSTAIATFGQGPLDIQQNRAAHFQNPCADTDQGSGCRTFMAYVGSVIIKKREMVSSVHGTRTTNENTLAERDMNENESPGKVQLREAWDQPFEYGY